MTTKNIKITCRFAIIVFLFLQLPILKLNLSTAIGYAVSAAAILDILYDRFLWRYNPLENTPRIFGQYNAVFYSSFNNRVGNPSTITIRQTLSHISIYEECVDGYSESITASLVKLTQNGQWHLYYTYLTHPTDVKLKQNDEAHHGTAILCIKENGLIEGPYFTNRANPTSGDLVLTKIVS